MPSALPLKTKSRRHFPICAGEPTRAEKLFAQKVHSLFQKKYLACHRLDLEQIESGFELRSRNGLLAGGELYVVEILKPRRHPTASCTRYSPAETAFT